MRAPAFEEIEQQVRHSETSRVLLAATGMPGGHARILRRRLPGGRLNRFPKAKNLATAKTGPMWREQDSNMKQ
jgi:hypothetical protein